MDTKSFIANIAANCRWAIRPNQEFLDTVAMGLEKNLKAYGYYLCPCRDGEGDKLKDADIICPCDYAAEDIEEHDQCYCGLFISQRMAASGEDISSIPDRRPEKRTMELDSLES